MAITNRVFTRRLLRLADILAAHKEKPGEKR